jgi:phage baseplate assembly protein W
MGYKIQKFNRKVAASHKVESWETRYGVSNRAVKRNADGTFVSNISGRQVVKGA